MRSMDLSSAIEVSLCKSTVKPKQATTAINGAPVVRGKRKKKGVRVRQQVQCRGTSIVGATHKGIHNILATERTANLHFANDAPRRLDVGHIYVDCFVGQQQLVQHLEGGPRRPCGTTCTTALSGLIDQGLQRHGSSKQQATNECSNGPATTRRCCTRSSDEANPRLAEKARTNSWCDVSCDTCVDYCIYFERTSSSGGWVMSSAALVAGNKNDCT